MIKKQSIEAFFAIFNVIKGGKFIKKNKMVKESINNHASNDYYCRCEHKFGKQGAGYEYYRGIAN